MSVFAPSALSLVAYSDAKANGNAAALKKKRLSSGRPLQELSGHSSNIRLNDDESERAKLRAEKQRAIEAKNHNQNEIISTNKRKSLGFAPGAIPTVASAAIAATANSSVKPLDLKSLNAMFQDCLKLATAGKINSKNAWQLDFISHMGSVLLGKDASQPASRSTSVFDGSSEDHGEENQFQKASCSLDASMMIYSSRVDDVHKSTFKVLGGLSNGGSADVEDDEDGEAATGGAEEQQKKKKVRKAGLSTLEPHPSKLDTRLLETDVEVDPLFHLTTAKFEGGAGGMLMNNLAIYHDVRLCLDSAQEFLLPQPTTNNKHQETQEAQLHLNFDFSEFARGFESRLSNASISTISEARISSAVDYFIDLKAELLAGGDGSGVEQAAHTKRKGRKESAVSSVDVELPTLELLPIANSADFEVDPVSFASHDADDDDDDQPLHSFGLSGVDIVSKEVADLDHAIAQEEALNRHLEQSGEVADAEDAASHPSESQDGASVSSANSRSRAVANEEDKSEFGLLDGIVDIKVNWAGLKHWKFKTKSVVTQAQSAATKGKKRTAAKSKETLDFANVPFAAVAPPKPTDAVKRGFLLSYPVTRNEKRTRHAELSMPEDRFYKLRALQTLCQKPNVMVKLRREGVAKSVNAGAQEGKLHGMQLVDSDGKNADHLSVPATPCRSSALEIVSVSASKSLFDGEHGVGGALVPNDADDATANQLQFASDAVDHDAFVGGSGFDMADDDDDDTSSPFGGPSSVLELIAAPNRAEKIEISYDRVSKTVDVKALKAAMWTGVRDTMHSIPVEAEQKRNAVKSTVPQASHQTTFQSAIDRVPVGDNFPAKLHHQLPSISVSYCFISMLHLCNEHGLTLVAPGANPDAESANRITNIESAAQQFPTMFHKDTAHVKLIGEKNPQAYYVGDFLVKGNKQ